MQPIINDLSHLPYLTNYEHIIHDLLRVVKEELTLVTRNLVLFGSYAKVKMNYSGVIDYFIPGESDIDLALIIDTSSSEEPTKLFANIVESLNSILFEPIYAPILDLTILESDVDLPPPSWSNFNLLHLHAANTSSIVLWGKDNFLSTYQYNLTDIKNASRSEMSKIYSDLKNAFLHRDMYRTPELFWLGVDSVLLSSLTYSNYLKYSLNEPTIVKLEVADFLNEQELDANLKYTINAATDFTLNGGPADGHFDFFLECLNYCREFVKLLM